MCYDRLALITAAQLKSPQKVNLKFKTHMLVRVFFFTYAFPREDFCNLNICVHFYPKALIYFESRGSLVRFRGVKPRKCFTSQLALGVQENCKVNQFCSLY